MLKKKTIKRAKRRIKLLPLALAAQFMMPAHLIAAEKSKWSKTSEAINKGMAKAQQVLHETQNAMMQAQARQQMMQMRQSLSLTPIDPSQVPPIIAQNGCMVLPAKTQQVSGDLSCEGSFNPDLYYSQTYDSMLSIAEENANDIDNFLTEGHERFTTQGKGCYMKAKNQLFQQLEARNQLLESMKESIANSVEIFKKKTEKARLEVKKADALLNGPGRADPEVAEAMKNFKFEDQFQNEACKSLGAINYASSGKQGGLRAIEDALKNNKEKMGAETFFASKKDYEKEIREIAREAAKQTRRDKNFTDAKKVLGSIRTRKIPNTSQALVTSFNIAKQRAENETKAMNQEAAKVVGGDKELQGLLSGIATNSVNVEAKIDEWERNKKNKCLSQRLEQAFGGAEGLASKLYDPNYSKKANEEGDSPFKNYIIQILNDDRYTVEQKMTMISRKQAESQNDRYFMTLGSSVNVKGKQIGASTRLRGKDVVNLFGQECVASFNEDPMGSGSSPKEAVRHLKEYAKGIEKVRRTYATDLQEEIVNGLLSCPDDTSTGKAAKSCGPKSLAPDTAGFCVRTANDCASNAMACHEDARKVVEKTRKKQEKIALDYKKEMDMLKHGMIAEFKSMKAQMEQSAKMIDGMYQMGTAYQKKEDPLKKGLTLNFTDTELLKGVDPSLKMEDPDKYLAKVVNNIDTLQGQLKEHQNQMMKGLDKEIEKYLANFSKQKKYWEGVKKTCQRKVNQEFERWYAEQNRIADEQQKEYFENREQACTKYGQFKSNPCPASGGSEFGELAGDLEKIAYGAGDLQSAQEINQIVGACDAFSNEDGENRFMPTPSVAGNSSKYDMNADQFCDSADGQKYFGDECARYKALWKDGSNDDVSDGPCGPRHAIAALNVDSHDLEFCVDAKAEKPYRIRESECEEGEEPTTPSPDNVKEALFITKAYNKYNSSNANKCNLDGISSENFYEQKMAAKEAVQEGIRQYKKFGLFEQAKQIQVAACESGVNSDPSMPDMGTPGFQRDLAGQNPGMMGVGY